MTQLNLVCFGFHRSVWEAYISWVTAFRTGDSEGNPVHTMGHRPQMVAKH